MYQKRKGQEAPYWPQRKGEPAIRNHKRQGNGTAYTMAIDESKT